MSDYMNKMGDDSLLDLRNKKLKEAMESKDQAKMAEKMDKAREIGNYLVEKMKAGLLGHKMDENGDWVLEERYERESDESGNEIFYWLSMDKNGDWALDTRYERKSGKPSNELFYWLVREVLAIQTSLVQDKEKHLFDFFEKFKRENQGSGHSLASSRDLTKKLAAVLKNSGFSPADAEKVKKVLVGAEAEEKALYFKARA